MLHSSIANTKPLNKSHSDGNVTNRTIRIKGSRVMHLRRAYIIILHDLVMVLLERLFLPPPFPSPSRLRMGMRRGTKLQEQSVHCSAIIRTGGLVLIARHFTKLTHSSSLLCHNLTFKLLSISCYHIFLATVHSDPWMEHSPAHWAVTKTADSSIILLAIFTKRPLPFLSSDRKLLLFIKCTVVRVSNGGGGLFLPTRTVVKNQKGKIYAGDKKYAINNYKFLSISIIFKTGLDKTLRLYLFVCLFVYLETVL